MRSAFISMSQRELPLAPIIEMSFEFMLNHVTTTNRTRNVHTTSVPPSARSLGALPKNATLETRCCHPVNREGTNSAPHICRGGLFPERKAKACAPLNYFTPPPDIHDTIKKGAQQNFSINGRAGFDECFTLLRRCSEYSSTCHYRHVREPLKATLACKCSNAHKHQGNKAAPRRGRRVLTCSASTHTRNTPAPRRSFCCRACEG